MLWNCSASVIRCWNPPGAQNWSFGSWAEFEGDGIWRTSNDFMTPESLYVAQLRDRLGNEVAGRVQLMPRQTEESSNPPLDKAQELAAASHQPAPQLTITTRRNGTLPSGWTLERLERAYLTQVLEQTNWRITGPRGAAKILGLNPSTLRFRMQKLGIVRATQTSPPPAGTAHDGEPARS